MTEISRGYASALFELACEQDCRQEFLDALNLIQKSFSSFPEYVGILSSPNIPLAERTGLVSSAFSGKVPEYVLSFTELMIEKGHIGMFGECLKEYEKLYRALSELSEARVVSAEELTEDEKQRLLEKLEKISGHRVEASYETDKSLIGGLVVYMDGRVIDGSIRSRIKDVKEVIGK